MTSPNDLSPSHRLDTNPVSPSAKSPRRHHHHQSHSKRKSSHPPPLISSFSETVTTKSAAQDDLDLHQRFHSATVHSPSSALAAPSRSRSPKSLGHRFSTKSKSIKSPVKEKNQHSLIKPVV